MPGVVVPPCPELVTAADALDSAIEHFLATRSRITGAGRWEAPLEGLGLSYLLLRNVEAVTTLARTDEALAAAAWPNTRAAFESAVRVIWLLHPGNRFESEARWLALVRERARFHHRMASYTTGEMADAHERSAGRLEDLTIAIERQLPTDVARAHRIPSVDQALQEMGTPEVYRSYIAGSQYLHGTMAATHGWVSRMRSPTGREEQDVDWPGPLTICWLALRNAGSRVVDRLQGGTDDVAMDWGSTEKEVVSAINAVAAAHSAGRHS